MPVVPTPLSLRAWEQVRDYAGTGKRGRRLLPFYSMVDRRRRLHREWLATPPEGLSGVAKAWIPYASAVERMGLERAPVGKLAPRSPAAAAFRALWEEVAAIADIARPAHRR